MDELSIEALKISENDELFDGGVVSDIPRLILGFTAPLHCSLAKERLIENIGLGCVGELRFFWIDLFRDEICFDRVRVNAIVDFGQGAIEIPLKRKATILVLFESLELFD